MFIKFLLVKNLFSYSFSKVTKLCYVGYNNGKWSKRAYGWIHGLLAGQCPKYTKWLLINLLFQLFKEKECQIFW